MCASDYLAYLVNRNWNQLVLLGSSQPPPRSPTLGFDPTPPSTAHRSPHRRRQPGINARQPSLDTRLMEAHEGPSVENPTAGLTRDEGVTNPTSIPPNPPGPGSMQFAAPVRPSDFLRAGRPAPQHEHERSRSMPAVTEIPEQIAAKVSSPVHPPCAHPREAAGLTEG